MVRNACFWDMEIRLLLTFEIYTILSPLIKIFIRNNFHILMCPIIIIALLNLKINSTNIIVSVFLLPLPNHSAPLEKVWRWDVTHPNFLWPPISPDLFMAGAQLPEGNGVQLDLVR